jgi:hypothetical protein
MRDAIAGEDCNGSKNKIAARYRLLRGCLLVSANYV